MPKVKISEYSTVNSNNTDINSINIDEGCAPSGINNAIREVMVHLKNWQTNASGDGATFASLVVQGTGSFTGAVTMSAGATLSGTNTLSGSNIMSGNINSSGSTNTFSGTVVMSGANTISHAAGTVSAPSITVNGDSNTGIFFPAADTIAFAEGGAEAMRIDSSGNVGIGNTTSSGSGVVSMTVGNSVGGAVCAVDTNGARIEMQAVDALTYLFATTNHPLTFGTNNTERARITSDGNLLVNGTSSADSSSKIQAFVNGGNGATGYIGSYFSGSNLANQKAGFQFGQTDLIIYGSVDGNGNARNNIYVTAQTAGVYLASGGTSWSSNSDLRLKNITGTYTNPLADILKLQPVKFTWKADVTNKPQVGVIAQSVQEVVPEALSFSTIPNETDDKTEYLSVRYTELIPLIIAAIQELKAELDTVKAELNTLKGA